ncbi:MAG: dienelactone hydrolase family protein [Myxococcota bacterium]
METRSQRHQVKTPDGTMPVYVAEPTAPGRYPAVIVVMEIFGVNKHIEEVTRRIAAEGYVALAPDLFYRAGAGQVIPYAEIQKGVEQAMQLRDDKVVADLSAALDFLAAKPNVNAAKTGITGFCMGGRISFLAACDLPDRIAAAAPFYGGGTIALLPKAASIKAPLQLFFGQLDNYIPQDQVKAIEAKLRELGKRYKLDNYAGADHGFFCSDRASYSEAAASDAWTKLKAFFREHLT